MDKLITDIAQIQTGIYEKPKLMGEVFYVQARHFDSNRNFIDTVKPDLPNEAKLQKHFLQIGDVLVAAKGYDHFAVDYKGKIKPAVASSMFIILRLFDTSKILPEFLAWFINQANTQNILGESSKGTALPSITKSDIGNLKITIPTIKKQKAILAIQALLKKEDAIRMKIKNLRALQIQHLILKEINKK